ncbi:spore coat protein [Rummeliibacillus pycnus]|uniref:spore coat protein n=1 Tax=Rummeliibacillus pycnus TaxID=101070 RepID=UPI003D2A3E4B
MSQQQPQNQMNNDPMYNVDSAKFNHGGHEVMDMHEALSTIVGGLNQCVLLRDHIQDTELRDILDRQYKFSSDEYNTLVESFKTGRDPSRPTGHYEMKENNKFTYGVQPGQPKKPITQASEISDEMISGFLLGIHKETATIKLATALETTNPVVRRVLADSIPNCIEMAYEVSIYQNRKGYYQVPQLSPQDMATMTNSYGEATINTSRQPSQFS